MKITTQKQGAIENHLVKYGRLLCFVLLLMICSSCEDEEEGEIERKNVVIQFENNSGDRNKICYVLDGEFYPVTFIVSYRDIQADIDLGPDGTGFLTVQVQDGEEINVIVQGQKDDVVVSNASVSVRTDSRPEQLKNRQRIVEFCNVFDLQFYNF